MLYNTFLKIQRLNKSVAFGQILSNFGFKKNYAILKLDLVKNDFYTINS